MPHPGLRPARRPPAVGTSLHRTDSSLSGARAGFGYVDSPPPLPGPANASTARRTRTASTSRPATEARPLPPRRPPRPRTSCSGFPARLTQRGPRDGRPRAIVDEGRAVPFVALRSAQLPRRALVATPRPRVHSAAPDAARRAPCRRPSRDRSRPPTSAYSLGVPRAPRRRRAQDAAGIPLEYDAGHQGSRQSGPSSTAGPPQRDGRSRRIGA